MRSSPEERVSEIGNEIKIQHSHPKRHTKPKEKQKIVIYVPESKQRPEAQ